jgi:hypothetical protein
MKILKSGLRFWITLASILSFVTGWIMLANAPKPDQQTSLFSVITARSAPTLEPLPPLSAFDSNANAPRSWFDVRPTNRTVRPFFQTGGS